MVVTRYMRRVSRLVGAGFNPIQSSANRPGDDMMSP